LTYPLERAGRLPGPESGAHCARASFPWPVPFLPSPPLSVPRHCSAIL
jgi:hypothetical protein